MKKKSRTVKLSTGEKVKVTTITTLHAKHPKKIDHTKPLVNQLFKGFDKKFKRNIPGGWVVNRELMKIKPKRKAPREKESQSKKPKA